MKLVIFGLTISSSWGNGHATLWRGLAKALIARGHRFVFFERDVPYYGSHRDLTAIGGGELVLYTEWSEILAQARHELEDADVAMITSYCPDALAATELIFSCNPALHTFYDMDTPVTLERLRAGEEVAYIGPRGLRDFDLVLSYTGGAALAELKTRLGARRVAPLYGSVDPDVHHPVPPVDQYRCDLSYLGTYSPDRQEALHELFLEPARRRPDRRFLIGGSLYPQNFPWLENIFYMRHVAPADHPGFYCSSRLTLNITRAPMAEMGFCPSGRLFEASACGVPLLSDEWEGLDQFFEPGVEILLARTTGHAIEALEMSDFELREIGRAGRERTLAAHTAAHRALELENILDAALTAPGGSGGLTARSGGAPLEV